MPADTAPTVETAVQTPAAVSIKHIQKSLAQVLKNQDIKVDQQSNYTITKAQKLAQVVKKAKTQQV